jgi:hypothetical protein
MYIGYFWLPFYFEHQCQWYFQQPAIQALLHSITYQLFLLIVILSDIIKSPKISLKIEYPEIFDYYNRLLSIDEETVYYQRSIISYLKIFVLIWMAGYVYRNINNIIRQRRLLEIMDLFTTILYILYIFLFIIAAIQVHLQWQFIINIDKWKQFEKLHHSKDNQSSNEYRQMKDKFMLIFWNINSEFIDIQMIANGVFTLIILCCIIHLCFFLLFSEYFGPLLVSLITTSKNIYRWFIFIFIFIFAYETSFLHLFSYYFNEKCCESTYYFNATINMTKKAGISRSFGNLKILTINLFFSLFGITKNELTQTYINLTDNSINYYFLNSFTSLIGSIIYGSFAFCARIILITMIIACIKRLYSLNKQLVLNNWKFARAKVYMTFISKDSDILPVPLNLIPTFRYMKKFFRKKIFIKKLIRKKLSQKKYLRNLNISLNQYNSHKKSISDNVMDCIVLRFLKKYHPFDIHSLKRTRQIQYKEELSNIRHYILDEIQSIQQANQILNKHISIVFFELDKH